MAPCVFVQRWVFPTWLYTFIIFCPSKKFGKHSLKLRYYLPQRYTLVSPYHLTPTTESVSYTHLLYLLLFMYCVCGNVRACASGKPVSYTHLDVYKRQSQGGVDDSH